MKASVVRFTTLFLCCLIVLSCSGGLPQEFPVPQFVVKDVFTGKDIAYANYTNRPVILYFFASW